jgi:uncharacterized protein
VHDPRPVSDESDAASGCDVPRSRRRPPLPEGDPLPDELPACCGAFGVKWAGLLGAGPLPGIDDEEGERLPDGLPPVVDAHVHLFPQGLFEALWRWFDRWGWPVRYRLGPERTLDYLLERGVGHVVAMNYAHKAGVARTLNAWTAELCGGRERVTPLATVFPGEEGASSLLDEAFAAGLAGVKLHCHVQCFAADDPVMEPIYAACARWDRPLVMHAGREPKSPGYACDPHELCGIDRAERVLLEHPDLRLCVPHLGADEFEGYERLLGRFDNLWLDTTMMLADYFDVPGARRLLDARPDRILYGTDFPNLPYAWDRELKRLGAFDLSEERLELLLGGAARGLFGIAS